MKKAICLLSGGLDSTTVLYYALKEKYYVIALTVQYGQLHKREIESAKRIAAEFGLEHYVTPVSLPWKGSSLLDGNITIPTNRQENEMTANIPSTYVPARNSIFLSLAASCAEAHQAETIFIGANALDYSGYPDCRSEYMEAFEEMIRRGTKAGVEGRSIQIIAPLLRMSKKEIVELGLSLGVPFERTWSCYQGGDQPCEICDSCQLRAKGFREAGAQDPSLIYAASSNR